MFTDFPNILQDGEPVIGVDVVNRAVISLPYARCFRVQPLLVFDLVKSTVVIQACFGWEAKCLAWHGTGTGPMVIGGTAAIGPASLLDDKILRRKGRY